MNKAQKKFIAERASSMFDYKFVDHGELEGHLSYMIYKFAEIDPTPDLEFYDIYRTDSFGKHLDVEDLYEQEAINSLLFIMRGEGDENVKEYVKGSHLITENAKYEIRKRSQGKFDE